MVRHYLVATICSLIVALFSVLDVQAAVVRSPVGVFQNDFGSYSQSRIESVYDQSGLYSWSQFDSGVTNWDTYFLNGNTHTTTARSYEWWSNYIQGGVIVFDLGAQYTIDGLALWNEEVVGIESFDVSTADSSLIFTQVGTSLFPTNNPENQRYGADVFDLISSVGRYIKLENIVVSTDPNPEYNRISMGEIAFKTTDNVPPVPLPSPLLLLTSGLAGIVGIRSRKK